MKKYVLNRGQSIEFINIDTSIIDNGETFTGFNPGHVTQIAMARILLPDLLPQNIHRVIYLDSDMNFNTNLEGKEYSVTMRPFTVNFFIDKNI